jgi:tetratricopeptide (TPR) repeat protein
MPFKTFCAIVLASFITVGTAGESHATYPRYTTEMVPIERLINNLKQRKSASPAETAQNEYRMARLYAMAYARDTYEIPIHHLSYGNVYIKEEVIGFSSDPTDSWPEYRQFGTPLSPKLKEAGEALKLALNHYHAAAAISPNDDDICIGLAWSLDQAGLKKEAAVLFRKIVSHSTADIANTSEHPDQYAQGRANEAAQYLIPILDSATDKEEIAKLKSLPKPYYGPQVETPILIPLESNLPLNFLIQHKDISFDMGMGSRRYLNWPTSKAGWLVFDKNGSGYIENGFQLFGTYTFFLFWKNGYEALSSLDDNFDGKLDGTELQNLSIWQDLNCDGKSDKSEVHPLADYGIASLSCLYSEDLDGMLCSQAGLTLTSGETRKTYDIVLQKQVAGSPR